MDKVIDTSRILLNHVLGIQVQHFCRGEDVYERLFHPQLFYSGQLARSLEAFKANCENLKEDAIYHITDRAGVEWILFTKGQIIIALGPFLTRLQTRQEILKLMDDLHLPRDQYSSFHDYNGMLPVVNHTQMLLAAHGILRLLDSPYSSLPVRNINLTERSQIDEELDFRQLQPKSEFVEHTHDLQSQFMEAIALGNTAQALQLLRFIRERTDLEVNINDLDQRRISGTIVRTLARIAARGAGVPSAELDQLTREHRRQTTNALTVHEIDRLMFELTERISSLVTRHRLSSQTPLARKAIYAMLRRLDQPLTVADIASDIGVSPNYLSAKFRADTGITLNEYLRDTRLNQAAQLLKNSTMPITNVGIAVGLPDSSYFARLFKKRYGVSPSQYRAQPIGELRAKC